MNLLKGLKNMIQRTGITNVYGSIFDINGIPPFKQFYNEGISVWKSLYKGFYNEWHIIAAPTIKDGKHKRELFRLNLMKAIAQELASMVWAETSISVSAEGFTPTADEPTDKLGEYIAKVLEKNNFNTKMREHLEKGIALGGGALKVWRECEHTPEGSDIPGTDRIRIGYAMADQFIPVTWDNSEIKEALFVSREARGGYYFTRLEWHEWDGETYVIRNELYRADRTNTAGEPQDILGQRYPLNDIHPNISEYTEIKRIDKSLFSYFRPATANNIDDNSPLGVSICANCLPTLHALDICFDSFVREFRLGKKRIIVPARAIRTVVNPETGVMTRYFDAEDEAYEALATDDVNDLKVTDNTVALRVEEHIASINAFLNILCLQIGFSPNTFTFDGSAGVKTATEVISENSKTYKTVTDTENMVRPAIERLVDNIISVSILYGITYDGVSIESLASRGYNTSVRFDDSVVEDKASEQNLAMAEVSQGLRSVKSYLVNIKGMTPEEADMEIQQIASEKSVNIGAVEDFFGEGE